MTAKNSLKKFVALAAATLAACVLDAKEPDLSKIGVSEKLKAMWNDPVLQEQIDVNIKANRMGDFFVEFFQPVSNVKIEQTRHEFLFGCNAFLIDGFRDKDGKKDQAQSDKYGEMFSKIFNFATVAFYWRELEPRQGEFRFDKNSEYIYRRPPIDESVEFCKKYNLTIKGHCLVWNINSQWGQPDWAKETRDSKFVEHATFRRIKAIAQRYDDLIKYWDIVNEAPTYRTKESVQFDDYVFKTFKECERLFSGDSTFIHNDTDNAWASTDKMGQASPMYLMNQALIARGAKLDVVGLQYHIFSKQRWIDIMKGKSESPEYFSSVMDVFALQNRPIHVTEITIPTLGDQPEENQAFLTECLYKIWFSHKSVEAITWWNLVDGTAVNESENSWKAGLLHRDFSPKKAYETLDRLINKEWHTSLSFDGEHKNVHFRAFYGTYKVSYTVNGTNHSKEITLSKKAHFTKPKTQYIKVEK